MSKELIEQMRKLSASRKPYATGAHGQIIGMESYRIVANGFALECIDEAADRIEELERERDTAWAQAHRLALELECLIIDTKDNAVVSKWWDSAFEAIEGYQALKPGANEEAEAWAKMRKAGVCAKN